jgi:DNA-binding NarL/FixJ family response regulator
MDQALHSQIPGRITAFIAEDSAAISERLSKLLEQGGSIDVIGQADTPLGAIDGILASKPDAVVLDIHLRGGSGLEVIRKVRAQAPQVVFVVLTNYPDPHYRRLFAEAGASSLLDKSTEFDRVKEEILTACAAQQANADHCH